VQAAIAPGDPVSSSSWRLWTFGGQNVPLHERTSTLASLSHVVLEQRRVSTEQLASPATTARMINQVCEFHTRDM
jgi:hypothetical protein